MTATPRDRVERLIVASRRIADPADPIGQQARRELPATTGLSLEGIELALRRCLETHPTDAEVDALCASVGKAPRAHVLLSANVFVGAHRAIALALAASSDVVVRPSRREPVTAELLRSASEQLFEISDELRPLPGEHLFAYASDETIAELRRTLPRGVVLHAHGSGMGVAIADARDSATAARRLADDVVVFDQRGCLSPRIALVLGDAALARTFAETLARALAELATAVPRGTLLPEELADERRFEDAITYAAELVPAGPGSVGLDTDGERLIVPPIGRNVVVVRASDPARLLAPIAAKVAALGVSAPDLGDRVRDLLPKARRGEIGEMQRPAFDGPVDRRTRPEVV